MDIIKPAVAGTMESSDCQVTIEPGNGGIELDIQSPVIHQFGDQIRKTILETLKDLDIENARLTVVDKGALDCTVRARVEAAAYRSVGQKDAMPWGGAIR